MPNFIEKLRSPIYQIESLTFLKLEMEVKKLRKFLSIMIYKNFEESLPMVHSAF